MLHELRVGEPATLGETPFARYYGTADATPLWLALLCDHTDWSGSLDLFRELRPQVDAALDWVDRHGDLDGDGLIEYQRRAEHGLANQGWKDSWDGVPDAAGAPLEPPVALVEVQGYAIRALRGIAALLDLDHDPGRAQRLRARADAIELALERFWLPEVGAYAIGLDGAKQPGSGHTSNPGHLLWAGALSPERARSVRDTLMGDAMFSGWGVRTLAAGHPGYNPIGYHTGSVWPHDNALFASGLREYGLDDDFDRLFGALLDASSRFADLRAARAVRGAPARARREPRPLPGRLPPAGLGRRLDPAPARHRARASRGRALAAAGCGPADAAGVARLDRAGRAAGGGRDRRPAPRALGGRRVGGRRARGGRARARRRRGGRST